MNPSSLDSDGNLWQSTTEATQLNLMSETRDHSRGVHVVGVLLLLLNL